MQPSSPYQDRGAGFVVMRQVIRVIGIHMAVDSGRLISLTSETVLTAGAGRSSSPGIAADDQKNRVNGDDGRGR